MTDLFFLVKYILFSLIHFFVDLLNKEMGKKAMKGEEKNYVQAKHTKEG